LALQPQYIYNMEEILKALQERAMTIKKENKIEWYETALKLVELKLQIGDPVHSIVEFLRS